MIDFLAQNCLFAMLAVLFGFGTFFGVYFGVKSHYRFKKSCNPNVYVSKRDTVFRQKSDVFLHTHTTHTHINRNHSHHGGSGGQSHSSGGHGKGHGR